jgi:medium-chain acyl-[acyl-carrier-protein] hydrolase
MTAFSAVDRWVTSARPRPRAEIRLFCFPYAGGGASVFRSWADGLPDWVEICPVQLPGRESRFREPAFTRLGPLVEALAGALQSRLDRPFAFFGHSLGALVAFELARRLGGDGAPQPAYLFISGCPAPQVFSRQTRVHALPDAELREELRGLNGTPAAVLANNELMELLLPTLRADFSLCETYTFVPGPRLTCPVSAWGGLSDETVHLRDLNAWRGQTTGPFHLRMLPGDHFFIQHSRPLLLEMVARDLLGAARGRPARHPVWEPATKPPPLGDELDLRGAPLRPDGHPRPMLVGALPQGGEGRL